MAIGEVLKLGLLVLPLCVLTACDRLPSWRRPAEPVVAGQVAPLPEDTIRPVARPDDLSGAPVPVSTVPAGYLGETVASLGNPAEQGLWLKTPLVKATTKGRLTYSGRTLEVALVPIEGDATAGSRISLQAMQALGIPLTELAEIGVHAL